MAKKPSVSREPQAFVDDRVKRCVEALNAKAKAYKNFWLYYDGKQPLVFSSERLRQVFRTATTRFNMNWSAVVVDATLDRLGVASFEVEGSDSDSKLANELWDQLELELEQDDVYRNAGVTGEGFIIVWRDAATAETFAYSNDSRCTEAFYDDDRDPQRVTMACKVWWDAADYAHLAVYEPKGVTYWVTQKKSAGAGTLEARAFVPDPEREDEANPFTDGTVPVFHFQTQRARAVSDLVNVLELHDAVSKLFSDEMVSAEFSAFAQRYIIGGGRVKGQLKNGPNQIWEIPAAAEGGGQVEVGQFPSTDLSVYYNAIEKIVQAIGTITSTPKHYFDTQAGDPSGEALIAMEAPLVNKVEKRGKMFSATWRRLMAALLALEGRAVKRSDISVVNRPANTKQPLTESIILQNETSAGVPLKAALRRRGDTKAEVESVMEDVAEEQANQPAPDPLTQQRQTAAQVRAAARQQGQANQQGGGGGVTNGGGGTGAGS